MLALISVLTGLTARLPVLVAVLAALAALPAVIIVVDFGAVSQHFAFHVQRVMMFDSLDFEFDFVEYLASAPFAVDVQVIDLFQRQVRVLQCRVSGSVAVDFARLCHVDHSRTRQHAYGDTRRKYDCYQYYNQFFHICVLLFVFRVVLSHFT